MSYNYEQSIWGRGVASLVWRSPTSFRLRQALQALKNLPPGSRVLEIGCGAGQFIRAVKKYRPDLICLGCDISQEALRMAREDSSESVEYELNEGCALPYADGSIDAALIFDVLEHVENPEFLLSEIRRVLKNSSSKETRGGVQSLYEHMNTPHTPPDVWSGQTLEGGFSGILYAFVPCEGDSLSWWHWLDKFGLKNEVTKKHAGHINYFSRKELLQLLIKHGFEKGYLRYSEHVLGQLLGIASFTMMDRAARKNRGKQLNNETFFTTKKSSLFVRMIKAVVNSLVFIESYVLSRIPSPNMHVVMKKKV